MHKNHTPADWSVQNLFTTRSFSDDGVLNIQGACAIGLNLERPSKRTPHHVQRHNGARAIRSGAACRRSVVMAPRDHRGSPRSATNKVSLGLSRHSHSPFEL